MSHTIALSTAPAPVADTMTPVSHMSPKPRHPPTGSTSDVRMLYPVGQL
jgi:hypothetical protein